MVYAIVSIVNVFLPSMKGTKIGFMRDLLSGEKSFLRSNEVNHMNVPLFQEISVKNIYPDAMRDETVKKYLPNPDQLSGKLPERDFFFGIMCTLKQQYMRDIIAAANEKRFKANPEGERKEAIRLSDAWLDELLKHPYHSSKLFLLIRVEKPGTGVYLLRESAKVSKQITQRMKFPLAKRMHSELEGGDVVMASAATSLKQKRGADGKAIPVPSGGAGMMSQNPSQGK